MERYTCGFDSRQSSPPATGTHMAMVSIPVGRWKKRLGRFKMQTLTLCDAKVTSTRTAAGQFKGQFKGAMDEMSGKFKMRALTSCDAKITSTCTTAGQIKGQFKGRWMKCLGRFKTQALTHCGVKIMSTRTAVGQFKGQFNGAMDESSGQGQKASTRKKPCCHGYRSLQN